MKMFFAILIILIGGYLLFTEAKPTWSLFGSGKDLSEEVKGADRINIDVSGMNTKIVPEKRSDLRVELDGKGDVDLTRRGDDIKVKARKGWFNWFGFDRTKLIIHIPEDYDQELELHNGSGNLTFYGPSDQMKLKSLKVEINSGNLKLENIHAKKFSHDASSGNVDVKNLKTDQGTFDISSGNVKIKNYTGALSADLSSGKLDVQMDELTGDIDVKISSGSAELDLPKDAGFKVKGKVSSGHIDCHFPLENEISDRKRIEGIHGSGDHRVDLSVSSGHIKIH
ncbi:DUF4097 domain-containing protein [Alkalihalobacillus sp. TS-13]|uniref:LiaG family protein n=1 Tax=Alkalihalobacillus sp. TS-13 TaxID=2842455 RepID=UPI001C8843F6|nr:DUF4097 domain-containing protein [Alkalihalobacillus sp. TS-13]